ncbi:Protein of uncharacterised function (DUF2591) [Serratia ficaria]|uniref:DUF2591 domain-containing protein n=1 Tax=Serratia ficaria TaxID=61651 RepID=UPI002182DF4B|nr:DUF2591 domain-containing protein [Serratia ficaria]CAI2002878.1 Protein of uncharacterised function (DUF2591) [Serratia ficaria]CAI2490719.1 Protein of uncharacterised function (DUF2591) [Serratia ficaria]
MTDYRNMSDFEINCVVAFHIGLRTVELAEEGKFNPCNNPADAWPIIVKHGISLTHDYGEWESEACLDLPVGAHGTDELCSVGGIDKNPLRAAMIAFLLLKESEKCSS